MESAKDRKAFVRMAWGVHRGHEHWVPPLISDQTGFIDPRKGVFFHCGRAMLFPTGAIRLLSNLKRTTRLRLILMGVMEQYRNMGIPIALIAETNEPMLAVFDTVRAERSKTYRIYRKELA